jgi:hypothetical protein
MKYATKILNGLPLFLAIFLLVACSNINQSGAKSGTGSGSATIGGSVTGLTGSGLVLQDNGGDSLTITANGPFTFKTAVTGTGAYAVTVLTQPTVPNQVCTVASGSGTATANVTNVAVTCVLAYTISGSVNGLVGSSMVLKDNGTDNLTITSTNANAYTFATLVPTGGNYAVTIDTQPSSPSQTCVAQRAWLAALRRQTSALSSSTARR